MAWNSTFAFFITDSFFLSLLDSSKHKLHHSFSLLFSLIYDWQSESCHKWSSISSLHLMMVFPLMDLFANPLLKVLRNFLLCFLNEEPGENSFVDSRQNDVNIYCLWQQNVAIDTGQTIFWGQSSFKKSFKTFLNLSLSLHFVMSFVSDEAGWWNWQ